MPEPAQHFVKAPLWEWWVLSDLFFLGIGTAAYAIGAMLRFWGGERHEGAARVAFLVSFPAFILAPISLIFDLGSPTRFFHMLWDPSLGTLNFKWWSPMSIGTWILVSFGFFSFVSFVEALALTGRDRGIFGFVARALRGGLGRVFNFIGLILALMACGYPGVLLAVSNQPVWSDGWSLSGVLVASALAGAVAVLLLLRHTRLGREIDPSASSLADANRSFNVLWAALLAIFLVTVALAGTIGEVLGLWLILWVVVVAGLAAPFVLYGAGARGLPPITAPALVLLAVIAFRAVLVFSIQV